MHTLLSAATVFAHTSGSPLTTESPICHFITFLFTSLLTFGKSHYDLFYLLKNVLIEKSGRQKKKKKHQINPDSKCTDFLSRIHRKPSATAWAAGDLDKTESENSKWPLRPDGLSDIHGLGSLLVWK